METLGTHRHFLIISNISKIPNVKSLIKAASAFGFKCIIVGLRNIVDDIGVHADDCVKFDKLSDCAACLHELNIPIVGIEILESAKSVTDSPFKESIALMPGNEGTGMSTKQKEVCDEFIYIPQYGNGTASLNVTVATSIVLYEYFNWSTSLPN